MGTVMIDAAYHRAWRAANIERVKKAQKKHRSTKKYKLKHKMEAREVRKRLLAKTGKTYWQLYRERHPEWSERTRWINIERSYGLTKKQFKALEKKQQGLCAICLNPPTGGKSKERLDVDHCHRSGKVRGLLCGPCNRLLGLMERYWKHKAAFDNYLEKHAAP